MRNLLILFLLIISNHISAMGLTQKDIDNLTQYIKSLQYRSNNKLASFGAFKISQDPGCYAKVGEKAFWKVDPYFVNLGLFGLLSTADKDRFNIVRDWLNWYLGHLEHDGTILNHWYAADGTDEKKCIDCISPVPCNFADSHDSYAATFLSLTYLYYKLSHDKSWFNNIIESKLELIGDLIISLQDTDGLTWARKDYKIKYLMDNCEVYDGLMALSRIEAEVFHRNDKTLKYENAASKVQKAISTKLYSTKTGLYITGIDSNGKDQYPGSESWYPRSVSLMWPQMYNIEKTATNRYKAQRDWLNNKWKGPLDWRNHRVSEDGSLTPSVGYAFSNAGDKVSGFAQAKFIIQQLTFPIIKDPHWTIGDAGWLIRNGILP